MSEQFGAPGKHPPAPSSDPLAGFFIVNSAIRDLHASVCNRLDAVIIRIAQLESVIKQQGIQQMSVFDDLEQEVRDQKGAVASVVLALNTIHQELMDALANNDVNRARQLLADLKVNTQAIADAVVANPDPAQDTVSGGGGGADTTGGGADTTGGGGADTTDGGGAGPAPGSRRR